MQLETEEVSVQRKEAFAKEKTNLFRDPKGKISHECLSVIANVVQGGNLEDMLQIPELSL